MGTAVRTTVQTDDLRPGDVVHYNSKTSWRLIEQIQTSKRTVTWRFEYALCAFAPDRVGTTAAHTFRRETVVAVTR